MGRIARAGLVALIAATVLALGPAAAQAAILDANCPGPSGPSLMVNANERYAQPFTALHSGTVARAQIDVSNPGAGNDFQLQILNTDAGGTPVNGILGSATIPDASVPVGTSALAAAFTTSPSVVAGTRYALVVTRPGGSTFNVP